MVRTSSRFFFKGADRNIYHCDSKCKHILAYVFLKLSLYAYEQFHQLSFGRVIILEHL